MFTMDHTTLHTLELVAAVVGQTVLLAAAWGFLGSVFVYNPLLVSDRVANLAYTRPSEVTWIATLLATILSVSTTTFLSIAFKEALRHRMYKSISLIHLSTGVVMARGAFFINLRHLIPTIVTVVVFAVTRLLVSSWNTLLTPDLVPLNVNATGWELDLTSNWFETRLQQELLRTGAALVRGNSTQIISLNGVLSGIAAAQSKLGKPGVFDFNGVQYNVSTGGILPAAPGYGGITDPVSEDNTGLAFAGGRVPTNLAVTIPDGQARQGLLHNFTLVQQGLTAKVACNQTSGTAGNLNFTASYNAVPVPYANGMTDYWVWAWNVTANCSEGTPSIQRYVTRSNTSFAPEGSMSGFISSLVCPYPLQQTGFSWERFIVATNASWRYSFLPLTVCEITPMVTTSLVRYRADGVIDTTGISSIPLGLGSTNLTQFLAAIIDYQGRNAQGLTTNSIGDALYSIYISTSGEGLSPEDVADFLVHELERYWRGVIEFTGTFLRSAFSTDPQSIPTEARMLVNGSEMIMTMGWEARPAIWAYTTLPITIVAFMTYSAAAYTVWQVLRGRKGFTTFDPSNPIHVMMVSSARDESAGDNMGDWLHGFERGGIGMNEAARVQLVDIPAVGRKDEEANPMNAPRGERKRFKVTQAPPKPL